MDEENHRTTYRNRSLDAETFVAVKVNRIIELGGQLLDDAESWCFEGLILNNTVKVHDGRLELKQCAVRTVEIQSIDTASPVLIAKSSLFRRVQVARGMSKLEYCTVLEMLLTENIHATDCLFLGLVYRDYPSLLPPKQGCIRYSRIVAKQKRGGMRFFENTRKHPLMFSEVFGERSCGVLHPATPDDICFGAEDSGEMGAYHEQRHCLRREAIVDKLSDYLPVGIKAVVIPDERLLCAPPVHIE